MASSSAAYWPTYMNPDNGALVSPTTTYTATYMGQYDGAPYTSVSSSYQNGNYAGSVSETVAVGEAFSVVMSSSGSNPSPSPTAGYSSPPLGFTDWESYGQYTAALANSNGTMTDDSDNYNSTSVSASSSSSGEASPIKIVTAAVPGAIGLALLVLGIWFCCRCKKRRRAKRDQSQESQDGGEGRYGQMEEIERGPVSATSRYQAPSLTRDEAMGVVSPRTRQRQDRIDLVPSRAQQAGFPSNESNTRIHQYNQLASPSGTFGPQYPSRGPASHVGSSRHSRWTDDSEFDVMAEDGSTITRTISTTSTRRTAGNEEDPTTPTIGENPFDHPAYTYRAAPPRSGPTLSRNNTLTRGTPVGTGTGTGTWSSSNQLSSALHSTLTSNTPVTPTMSYPSSPAPSYIQPQHQHRALDQTPRRIESDAYSIHSSEDGIFGPSASGSASASASFPLPSRASTRQAMRREPTIIRHADSYAQGPGRYSTKIERAGRDDAGVVELPPLYEDATSSWTR